MTNSSTSEEPPRNPLQIWYLCEEYTIVQAALLIAGHDPGDFQDVEQLAQGEQPAGYAAARYALLQRLSHNSWEFGKQVDVDAQRHGSGVDVHQSIVYFGSVRDWLAEQGHTNGFFFGKVRAPRSIMPSYLNRDHPRYAPKLAAAVRAWEAAETQNQKTARSPKTMLRDWLKDHAAEFGPSRDGKLSESGIEQAATVANWKPEGGAPQTSGKA